MPSLVSARRRSSALSAVAITTVDRPVTSRLERDRGIFAAIGTRYGMHLARASIVPAAAAAVAAAGTLGAPCLTAGWAALGLIRVALLGMVRLIIG